MMYRMVDGDLQAKIIEAGKFNAGYDAIFFQGLPDSGDRKEDHGAEFKIIEDAPRLIIIKWMKGLPMFAFVIEIRIDQACFCGLSHLKDSLKGFRLDRNLLGPR